MLTRVQPGRWHRARRPRSVSSSSWTRRRMIAIRVGADRPVYRPGETAHMAMTTTLQGSSPVQSALGIGIVDESVFAVQDQAPGFARSTFCSKRFA